MRSVTAAAVCAAAFSFLGLAARADEPGRGLTAQFEIDFLKFSIDHHFSALRLSELAAGTDTSREAKMDAQEGTSPTPDFEASPPKAGNDQLRSMARTANRVQREEIMQARDFLKKWYGIDYEPQLTAEGRQKIEILESAPAGPQFDQAFIEVFSRHHYNILPRAVDCLTSRELKHHDLENYCRGILDSQIRQIDDMRHSLCKLYGICDYQPLEDPMGKFTK
jgi:uncharacterized protein (DUF305 family)